jgi:hypothetical protein
LVPLRLPLRIQRVEKLLPSEIKPLETDARTQTENMGNTKSISSNCSPEEELGFSTPHKPCDVAPYKIGKDWNETCSKVSAPALYRNQFKKLLDSPALYRNQSKKPPDSTQSQQTTLAHKFKASKRYVKSVFSKASKSRGANDHHSHNSIQRRAIIMTMQQRSVEAVTEKTHIQLIVSPSLGASHLLRVFH